jgi:hypothetical protein
MEEFALNQDAALHAPAHLSSVGSVSLVGHSVARPGGLPGFHRLPKEERAMSGYLALAICVEDYVPVSFHATLEEAQAAASRLTEQDVMELNTKLYDDNVGRFLGLRLIRFENGKPISVTVLPVNTKP